MTGLTLRYEHQRRSMLHFSSVLSLRQVGKLSDSYVKRDWLELDSGEQSHSLLPPIYLGQAISLHETLDVRDESQALEILWKI